MIQVKRPIKVLRCCAFGQWLAKQRGQMCGRGRWSKTYYFDMRHVRVPRWLRRIEWRK